MKVGDLVRCTPDVHGDENRVGVIIGWLMIGGNDPTLWEVLYGDGEIESSLENELEAISESR